jgi:hypothetical protein
MRCEAEVHERLYSGEVELSRLSDEISRLGLEVKLGADGWRAALEKLSEKLQRKRALQAQLDSLRWVLMGDSERLAS